MRVLHFADLHIGVENYGRVDPNTGFSTRLNDFLGALDEVVEYSLSENIDLVILAGDAYKNRDPSQTQQREFALRLARLSEAGIPTFLLVGNHDLPHAVGRATALEIFQTLNVPNLHVGDELQTYMIPTKHGPIQILAVPWPRRSQLLSKDESKGLSIGQVNDKIQELFSWGIQQASKSLEETTPAILAGHVTVSGAKLGSERAMMLGQDHFLLPNALHLQTFDYIALGHIHKHQILRENPLMVYSGSLQRVDFGEEEDPKGFCVIDLDLTKEQGKRVVDFQFHQVQARRFLTLDIAIPTLAEDPTQEVVYAIMRKNVADAIVRLRISLTAEQSASLREPEIRTALQQAHYITSITRQVEDERRTRLPADVVDGLDPISALELYLESKQTDPIRLKQLLGYAKRLMTLPQDKPDQDSSDPTSDKTADTVTTTHPIPTQSSLDNDVKTKPEGS